ncbi:MAG: glycosyltransferase family 39 protein [Anaerolineae bacterium]|nr:glycosyltransferase family 39 protein [Anaerolineae bacterium]
MRSPFFDSRRVFWIALIVITGYAGALRLYKLDSYPQIFNQDEMVLGYDAWSIWTTGRDQHGQLLPIHFRTFNDFVPPVPNYVTAPFVGLLGLSEFSTRLPAALLGIATVWMVGVLGRRWFGSAAGLLAALFLSVDNWHINYSRIAFPASFMPFFTVIALYTFTRAMSNLTSPPAPLSASREGEAESHPLTSSPHAARGNQRHVGWIIASGLCFALLTATYPTMKVQGPLLFGTCLLAAALLLWRNRRMAILWIGVYLLCISPVVIDQLLRWNLVQTRFNSMSVFGYPDWPIQVVRLYVDHYNPTALMFEGFGGGMAVHPPYIGQVFWLVVPLWIAAVVGLSQDKTRRIVAFSLPILLGVWFFTYPIASSLTTGNSETAAQLGRAHEIRSYNFLPLPELLAGYGAVVVWRKLTRYRWGKIPAVGLALGMVALIVGFNLLFIPAYFEPPWLETRAPGNTFYNIGLRPMLELVTRGASVCDVIWIDNTNQAYMYYLFLTRYPPRQWQQFSPTLPQTGAVSIKVFDNVRFGVPPLDNLMPPTAPDCAGKPYRAFFVTQVKPTPPGWQEIGAVRNKAGQAMWHVVESPPINR